MRHLFISILLLVLLLPCCAGSVTGGQGAPELREVARAVVIRLLPGKAVVDNYTVISGIPPGRSVTCILPLQQQAEDFSVAGMDDRDFLRQYQEPAHYEVSRINESATGGAAKTYFLTACAVGSICAANPLIIPAVLEASAKPRERARSSTPRPLAGLLTVPALATVDYLGKTAGVPEGIAKAFAPKLVKTAAPYCAILKHRQRG